MPTIPLFGTALRGKSRFVTAQDRINLFVEQTVDGDKYQTAYYSRPGLTRLNPALTFAYGVGLGPSGPALGVLPMLPNDGTGVPRQEVLWIARNGGWEAWISPAEKQTFGGADGDTTPTVNYVSMAYGGPTNRGFAVDGRDAWWIVPGYLPAVVPVSRIGGFPWDGARSVCYLASRLIVDVPAYPGRFAFSPLNFTVGTVWDALDYRTAESAPDALVCVSAHRGELILWGTSTIEFWAPSPTNVFANIQGSTAPWGLVSQRSIAVVGENLLFVGVSQNGKAQVCLLNGYRPQVVSTPDIDYLINVELDMSQLHAAAFSVLGHEFYTLNLGNSTLVFDLKTQSWSHWQTDAEGDRWAGQFVVECFGKLMVSDYRDTREHELTPDVYNDDGGAHFIREITGRHVFSDMQRITVQELILDIETGEGPAIYEPAPAVAGEPILLDSVVLQFFNSDNTGVQFLTSAPGTNFVRIVGFDIGTGGNVYDYNGTSNRSAIYNAHDDKMYFLSHKSAPVEGDFLVQFDPRAMVVSNEMELPAGWIVDDTFVTLLLDCTDERAWIANQTDGTIRAFDTVTMTQVFTDGGAFSTTPYTDPYAMISCGNGVVLLEDESDPITHRVTVTGATTFTDTTITHADYIFWKSAFDNGMGSYQRLWNQTLNRVVVTYSGGFGGELIDVAAATATPFDFNATWTGSHLHVTLENYSIWWDVFSGTDRIVVAASLSGVWGIAIFDADGMQQGVCCRGQSDWDSSSPAMPLGNGLVWSAQLSGDAFSAGGFSLLEADPSPGDDPPEETYPSDAGDFSFDDYTRVCIAPSRYPPDTPSTSSVDAVVERAPQVMLQLSKDGGRTYGHELWNSMGKLGEYRTLVRWTRLGRARDLVFRFRVADPVKVTLQGASARINRHGDEGV